MRCYKAIDEFQIEVLERLQMALKAYFTSAYSEKEKASKSFNLRFFIKRPNLSLLPNTLWGEKRLCMTT